MNSKIKLCVSTLLLSLLITGCGPTSKPTTPTSSTSPTTNNDGSSNTDITIPLGYVYKVTFKNYDGTILHTESVAKGNVPTYNGILPKKPASKTHYYTFKGWDKEIAAAAGDVVYVAQFDVIEILDEIEL